MLRRENIAKHFVKTCELSDTKHIAKSPVKLGKMLLRILKGRSQKRTKCSKAFCKEGRRDVWNITFIIKKDMMLIILKTQV